MPTVSNVSAGKPKLTGAVYRADAGTALPTDATTALAAAFKELGFVSEDGVTNNNTPESDNIKAWGGQTVLVVQNEKNDEFTFTLIEALNVEVLKTVYGSTNVTETNGAITIKATADPIPNAVYVIDVVMTGGKAKRIVIPDGAISEIGEIVYKDDEPIGYELTVNALPDASGVNHYEYIA
jgi:hypothetical protein